ncbi:MAG: cytoplasmic protein [Rhodobacteraceae bacterium]|nr:cytoplasmic protein [Paracoccaceae bacterium]
MALPIMAKATAVWLVDNTMLTFKQIGDFCGLHELEIQGIADGEVASGIKGFDPISNNQLDQAEIERALESPSYKLILKHNPSAEGETKKRGPRYTPLSKRQDRPSAIAWLVKFHPELTDAQISKLVGTTKPTILTIRDRSHWNISNIQPVDPVALGLCKQLELDAAVRKAAEKLEKNTDITSEEDKIKLMSTEQSLKTDEEPKIPSSISGLEKFSLSKDEQEGSSVDADSLFNLPPTGD